MALANSCSTYVPSGFRQLGCGESEENTTSRSDCSGTVVFPGILSFWSFLPAKRQSFNLSHFFKKLVLKNLTVR